MQLLSDIKVNAFQSSQLLMVVCDVASRAHKSGRTASAMNVLDHICCEVIGVIKQCVEEQGLKEVMKSHCHIFTLVANLMDMMCNSKNACMKLKFWRKCER